MPYEVLFKNLDEANEKVKKLVKEPDLCLIKVNKENVKLKIRDKNKLYTLVFSKENVGVSSVEELKKVATDIATKISCKETKEL
ncbi:hypothetical protein IOK49_04720 [Fervidicoccus fontis]|uniref:Uncharacterized protein n=2 Tax=Fervidicoccus fontis TaxID=683846 RepID=I0A263_FERFK|nr:hypothetical protein [Fervidicoccus fontis]AFH43070.1 hypothetical protein FFONT_1082 [Fervidicoccus fontis Kam940]MBE9391376.1 hypothetical protein [Fervidicoccus fontis]PMB75603.1 MAG: hypothetical protein C0188_02475 [Fervidicoccus fontis]HEW64100.1 hypothetical protein [Fervidicoccus fontis]